MSRDCTESTFLKDVSDHQMTVVHDDGLYRHLRFQKPGTVIYYFGIVTWPGHLCYYGDMGCFVFSRLQDMFEFFRDPDGLRINPGYWAEKCEAPDRNGGILEYDPDKARKVIKEWMDESDQMTDSIREAIEEDVLRSVDSGEQYLREAVDQFEHDGFRFHDFWETNLRDYTYRFIWCCYALAWGIEQYDSAKIAGVKAS
jgi:hypothetical protein